MSFFEYLKQNRYFYLFGILIIFSFIILSFSTKHSASPKKAPLPTPSLISPLAITETPTQAAAPSPFPTIKSNSCHIVYASTTDTQAVLPDQNCTPGATDAAVTQAMIHSTICTVGYAAMVRSEKPESYYENLKKQQIKAYGYIDTNTNRYEEDHLIPLELGGSNDPKNLWPEFDNGQTPNEKDRVEAYLHQQVCLRTITLAQGQQEFTRNWYNWYTVALHAK